MFPVYLQQFINGLTIGSVYALIALGLHDGVRRPRDDQLRARRRVHGRELPRPPRPGADGSVREPRGRRRGPRSRRRPPGRDGRLRPARDRHRADRLSSGPRHEPPRPAHRRAGRLPVPPERRHADRRLSAQGVPAADREAALPRRRRRVHEPPGHDPRRIAGPHAAPGPVRPAHALGPGHARGRPGRRGGRLHGRRGQHGRHAHLPDRLRPGGRGRASWSGSTTGSSTSSWATSPG